jgi:hypothetical protein
LRAAAGKSFKKMFEHFLAGELIFLIFGKLFGLEITPTFLIFGSFCGFVPDLLSYFLNKRVRYDKWYYSHRDNFSHSIFLPLVIFAATAFPFGWKISFMISLAALTHPLLDLYGLGWGVKLFLPISDDIYKVFHKKKIIYIYENDKERDKDVVKFQTDDWFQKIYLRMFREKKRRFGLNLKKWRQSGWWVNISKNFDSAPKWWGFFEWVSFAIAVYLPILYFFINSYRL